MLEAVAEHQVLRLSSSSSSNNGGTVVGRFTKSKVVAGITSNFFRRFRSSQILFRKMGMGDCLFITLLDIYSINYWFNRRHSISYLQ